MSWHPPKYYKGDVVLWHDGLDASARSFVALVTECGKDGLVDLYVIPTSAYNGFPKSGVRHAEDPNKHAIHNQDDGVWSETERAKLQYVAKEKVR